MPPAENKTVIIRFVEEVINLGQLERADDLVAVDFVELDPLLVSNRDAKVLNR
jgi:hypothetical protein